MSTNASVTVPDFPSGKEIDNALVTRDGRNYYRQRVETHAESGLIFSTTTLLGDSETYDSGVLSLVGYTQVATAVLSAGVGGTILITWYQDSAGTDLLRTISIPYTAGSGFKYFSAPAFTPYVRYRFTTSGAGQTDFYFDTKVTQTPLSPQILGMTDFITDGMASTITRSIMTGKTEGGDYLNVPLDVGGKLKTSLPLTAFGDLRTAELSPVFQASFEYTVSNTEIGTKTETNGGTVTQANAMCVANTSTTTASVARWQSKYPVKYRPGLGGLVRFTAKFTTGAASTLQFAGLIDEAGSSAAYKNGYAVGYNGATFSFLRWQNDTLFPVAQSSWDDPLDGTGPSGMTLDPTNLNVFFIEFQYLGAGAVNLYVESDVSGEMILAHTLDYSGLYTVPSVYMPNFYPAVGAHNLGTTQNLTVSSASIAFFVEGYTKYKQIHQPSFSSDVVTASTVTTEVPLFTIRNKSTYASKTNHISVALEYIAGSVEATSAANLGAIRLVKDATLTGTPSWADISTSNSLCEKDVAASGITGGRTIQRFALAGKNDKITQSDLTPYQILLAPSESITVMVSSANSADFTGFLGWRELF